MSRVVQSRAAGSRCSLEAPPHLLPSSLIDGDQEQKRCWDRGAEQSLCLARLSVYLFARHN